MYLDYSFSFVFYAALSSAISWHLFDWHVPICWLSVCFCQRRQCCVAHKSFTRDLTEKQEVISNQFSFSDSLQNNYIVSSVMFMWVVWIVEIWLESLAWIEYNFLNFYNLANYSSLLNLFWNHWLTMQKHAKSREIR